MQFDFTYVNPTKIYFGENSINNLKNEMDSYGSTIMLAYGGGSIKKIGLYDEIVSILRACGKSIIEFSGIMPNPTAKKVYEGIEIAKTNHVDFILAVGGGSVIDCAKAVAIGALCNGDFWSKFFENKETAEKTIPIGSILTMTGTGSEMNGNAVITNEEKKIKSGINYLLVYPKFSILNPKYTYSVPQYQMVSGICDILSHLMEVYFSEPDEDNLSDDLTEAIMKNVIRNARVAVKNPEDYAARSNLMWAATWAINGLIKCSKKTDWEVHQIEHQIAAYYDIAHGMGLSAVSASYYRLIYKYGIERFKCFAVNVWNVNPENKSDDMVALEGIDCLENFFREIGATTTLSELGIPNDDTLVDIANSCNLLTRGYKTLTHADVLNILKTSM